MHTHMSMTSKNVAIRRDVYDALRRERRPQESFTKLFVRLLNQRGPLEELYGGWPRTRASPSRRRPRRVAASGGRR